MTSEQSKPIALDERDAHSFFCMFGRYEPAMALGIIVMLSVWALFIVLHRTMRGQRRKKDENSVETEVREVEKTTIKEERICHTESTENLSEDVSKAQDNSIGERGGVVSLPHDPGLCDGALDELTWTVIGEYQTKAVPESHDNVKACWDIPLKHKVKELASENQKSLKVPASNTEVERNLHKHVCDNMESLLDHFDHDIETEKKAEFLYSNLSSLPDLKSEKMRLSIMEQSIKNRHDYLDNNDHRCSSQQNDLLNSVGDSSMFQEKIHIDSKRNCQLEETCRITEINVMETTVKSHQEILTDYQHLREHCEHLSNFHYHGLLNCLHERDSDRHQPLSDPSQVNAAGEISDSKVKSRDGSMTQPPEDNYEKTEINIMEATMDYNEWMNGSTVEMNKMICSSGKILNGTGGLGDVGTAEQCLQKSADSNFAKISITKESGATFTLFDGDPTAERAAAVQPMHQKVAVSFCVHYITHSPLQLLAVTGNQQALGNWEKFVPLRSAKDGFWANSVALPADSHVEWKFVVVENGRIHRWEECSNRQLQTGYEEVIHLHKWWGCA
ncbi:uncharacterized protein stbd1 [Anguilla rostrata]|uniref:uncharacterized protein stbd1 n=1 Tax=Anguilla rostrata TaxID=7938 RepID=UPI0030CB0EE8